MDRRPGGPLSQSWRTFLTNHVSQLASIDFFTVPTATFRVLFVFVVLFRIASVVDARTPLANHVR
jgi:hypothetical protein